MPVCLQPEERRETRNLLEGEGVCRVVRIELSKAEMAFIVMRLIVQTKLGLLLAYAIAMSRVDGRNQPYNLRHHSLSFNVQFGRRGIGSVVHYGTHQELHVARFGLAGDVDCLLVRRVAESAAG